MRDFYHLSCLPEYLSSPEIIFDHADHMDTLKIILREHNIIFRDIDSFGYAFHTDAMSKISIVDISSSLFESLPTLAERPFPVKMVSTTKCVKPLQYVREFRLYILPKIDYVILMLM